jgi:hypothetical protein
VRELAHLLALLVLPRTAEAADVTATLAIKNLV